MARITVYILIGALLCGVLVAKQIDSLPFLNWTPSFQQYAGYINVNQTHDRNLFYWFVEAQTNPETAPLLFWNQGGPGCSSLLGFFTEHGPFIVSETSAGIMELVPNPYSWNRVVNIVYVESPCGVGYSYSSQPSSYVTGDNQTMNDMANFVEGFIKQYPQFASNPIYFSGESYGGHYVPQNLWTLTNRNTNLNIAGMLVGNPWSDDQIDSTGPPVFIGSHALSSLDTFQQVVRDCHLNINGEHDSPRTLLRRPFRDFIHPLELLMEPEPAPESVDAACNSALRTMIREVGDDINQYDIYWPCDAGVGLDCMNYTLVMNFLQNEAVMEALGVNSSQINGPWSPCTTNIQFETSWKSVIHLYPFLAATYPNGVLVYSGDVTYNCPYESTEKWLQKIAGPLITGWTPYFGEMEDQPKQVLGYTLHYTNGLRFATVKNAGHMVPQFQPEAAFTMLQLFLNNTL